MLYALNTNVIICLLIGLAACVYFVFVLLKNELIHSNYERQNEQNLIHLIDLFVRKNKMGTLDEDHQIFFQEHDILNSYPSFKCVKCGSVGNVKNMLSTSKRPLAVQFRKIGEYYINDCSLFVLKFSCKKCGFSDLYNFNFNKVFSIGENHIFSIPAKDVSLSEGMKKNFASCVCKTSSLGVEILGAPKWKRGTYLPVVSNLYSSVAISEKRYQAVTVFKEFYEVFCSNCGKIELYKKEFDPYRRYGSVDNFCCPKCSHKEAVFELFDFESFKKQEKVKFITCKNCYFTEIFSLNEFFK